MILIIYNFTHNDYIKFIHNIKQNKYFCLNEEKEKYEIIRKSKINNIYVKIIENLLKDRKRIENMISRFSQNTKMIEDKELDIKTTNINTENKNLEYIKFIRDIDNTRILYKYRNNIFYLIIYQKNIDINLPYTILNYCIKINKYCKREHILKPLIIPIVIYSQNDKNIFEDKKVNNYFKVTTYDNNIIELKYNLINLENIFEKAETKDTILEELVYAEALLDNEFE